MIAHKLFWYKPIKIEPALIFSSQSAIRFIFRLPATITIFYPTANPCGVYVQGSGPSLSTSIFALGLRALFEVLYLVGKDRITIFVIMVKDKNNFFLYFVFIGFYFFHGISSYFHP